jgi:hypothetical protein
VPLLSGTFLKAVLAVSVSPSVHFPFQLMLPDTVPLLRVNLILLFCDVVPAYLTPLLTTARFPELAATVPAASAAGVSANATITLETPAAANLYILLKEYPP